MTHRIVYINNKKWKSKKVQNVGRMFAMILIHLLHLLEKLILPKILKTVFSLIKAKKKKNSQDYLDFNNAFIDPNILLVVSIAH